MSMDIPLTINVRHRIGLSEVTESETHNIAAVQLVFYCHHLFWLLEHLTIGAPHIPTLNNQELLDAVEAVSELGKACALAALPHIDELESIAEREAKNFENVASVFIDEDAPVSREQ